MNFKKNYKGMLLCLIIAIPCWFLGKKFPIVGGPVFAILLGMVITLLVSDKSALQSGITFVSKKILQYAVILLGFGMNLSVILQTGKQSLPIILATITTSLVVAWVLHKILHVPGKISTLIGVGSSICGGSAIAATAPVIDADDAEVAQSISVIFFFNMLAALFFPMLGTVLGFSQTSGEAFGIFAGTAVNDTSSVTAAASTWDSMYNLLINRSTKRCGKWFSILIRKSFESWNRSMISNELFGNFIQLTCSHTRLHQFVNLSKSLANKQVALTEQFYFIFCFKKYHF